MKKIRADQLLCEQGLARTRSQARALIMAGQVYIADDNQSASSERVEKAGRMLSPETLLALKDRGNTFVSRGGLKLEGALEDFNLDLTGLRILDIGASTGGFTDCALKRGAAHVTAVDVGYGQLDWRLRDDPRVEVLERTNARYITPDQVTGQFDMAVIDVSFISLSLILPAVLRLIGPKAIIVALVKPQFEIGREKLGKGGVVRDERIQLETVDGVAEQAREIGLHVSARTPSRLKGPKGNQEYFLLLSRSD
jgi:23S rRNA (cytidine1920-2'-O)/16S rRNA (cytidine1409-2'-O)-methyltransferase